MAMPYLAAFPQALGTGIIISTEHPLDALIKKAVSDLIEGYESALSRFREDSLLTQMGRADRGGSFDFPDYCENLFDLYDSLYELTQGGIDPMIGADLTRLGYGRDLTFKMQPGTLGQLGQIHGRPTWGRDLTHHGSTLVTRSAVQLDFGACGKGYLVDLISDLLQSRQGDESVPASGDYLIDAGGDMRIRSSEPVQIAMEDPGDLSCGVGQVSLSNGSLCASAPSRRRWTVKSGGDSQEGLIVLHHILNAIDGLPANQILATWVVDQEACIPTARADGLATALFLVEPDTVAQDFHYSCAIMDKNRYAFRSDGFPGWFFTEVKAHQDL